MRVDRDGCSMVGFLPWRHGTLGLIPSNLLGGKIIDWQDDSMVKVNAIQV